MSVNANDSLPQSRTMTVADDGFVSVSEGRIRIRIGAFIFMFVLLLVILRLAEVSLFGDKGDRGLLPQEITTTRADIIDRNGEVLATTLKTYSLYAEPRRFGMLKKRRKSLSQCGQILISMCCVNVSRRIGLLFGLSAG